MTGAIGGSSDTEGRNQSLQKTDPIGPELDSSADSECHRHPRTPVKFDDAGFLLSPRPRQSRRAVLIGIGSALAGCAFGFVAGRATDRAPLQAAALEPRFAWADTFGRETGDAELLDGLPGLLGVIHEACGVDLVTEGMRCGIARAAALVIADERAAGRAQLAGALLTVAARLPGLLAQDQVAALGRAYR
ncbi:MAG: hypothetical protein IPK26_21620 [Planctomycetes bacterium]|nr:hypothetical protein [Planctomycetota bacterium]